MKDIPGMQGRADTSLVALVWGREWIGLLPDAGPFPSAFLLALCKNTICGRVEKHTSVISVLREAEAGVWRVLTQPG